MDVRSIRCNNLTTFVIYSVFYVCRYLFILAATRFFTFQLKEKQFSKFFFVIVLFLFLSPAFQCNWMRRMEPVPGLMRGRVCFYFSCMELLAVRPIVSGCYGTKVTVKLGCT